MKHRKILISLYILIPVIFGGIALISSIVAYKLSAYHLQMGGKAETLVVWWSAGIVFFAVACSLIILHLILKPVVRFVKDSEKILSFSPPEKNRTLEITADPAYYSRVFDRVTDILSKVEAKELFPRIIGPSQVVRDLLTQMLKVAPTDATVLIQGESGTGKELVATSIYEHSSRKDGPFIKLNCVAIPEGLLESELFGHEKGAFTGALAQKKGKFELADGGTIFLDEIGDMPLSTQAKILRVLQEQEFERVGGTRTIRVDVRFIAATNKNLQEMVKTEAFREDLFYRLNVFSLQIPPLRKRREDIPFLIDHFRKQADKAFDLSPQALQLLLGYHWPGNIRELQNVIQRSAVVAVGAIGPAHLPDYITGDVAKAGFGGNTGSTKALDHRLQEIEKAMIIEAMTRAGGIQARAAQVLGINQRSLWHRIKKYQIDVPSFKKVP